MKIKFLGTAASEGWPALFCKCEACESAKRLKGKNIRTRSSCLIDETFMVDFGPDTYMHKIMYDLDLSKLKSVLITHSHPDHFYPSELEYRHGCFAYELDKVPLMLLGNKTVEEKFYERFKNIDLQGSVQFKSLSPFVSYWANNVEIIPLPANHAPKELCFIYIIKKEGKTILYGHDSGRFSEETWSEILKHRFDGVIMDCTYIFTKDSGTHMGVEENRVIKKRMLQEGAANDDTKFIITHFSHNGMLLHNEIEERVINDKFIVAHDGLEIEI